MSIFDQISVRIIKEQEMIIGPVAWEEARKVPGLRVANQAQGVVALENDGKEVVNRLVAQYSKLFGRASEEVCKEAVQDLIVELPVDQVPASLK